MCFCREPYSNMQDVYLSNKYIFVLWSDSMRGQVQKCGHW